jgi:hypothetical protein
MDRINKLMIEKGFPKVDTPTYIYYVNIYLMFLQMNWYLQTKTKKST